MKRKSRTQLQDISLLKDFEPKRYDIDTTFFSSGEVAIDNSVILRKFQVEGSYNFYLYSFFSVCVRGWPVPLTFENYGNASGNAKIFDALLVVRYFENICVPALMIWWYVGNTVNASGNVSAQLWNPLMITKHICLMSLSLSLWLSLLLPLSVLQPLSLSWTRNAVGSLLL